MIIVSFGANIDSVFGNPINTYNAMPDKFIEHKIAITKTSHIYKTPAYPDPSDPQFLNAAFEVETSLTALELLNTLNAIESEAGRVRTTKNAPRPLDLDILDYNGHVIDTSKLTLPHPHLQSRAFVLYPLRDIAPEWTHPISNQPIQDIIKTLPKPHAVQKIR